MVFQPALIPYKFLIHAVLLDHPEQSRSWRGVVFRAPMDLPCTKVPVTTCLWRMRLPRARVRPTWPVITLCHMPSLPSPSTSCPIPIGVGWGIIRTISEEKKFAIVDSNFPLSDSRYGEMTTWAAVLDFDYPAWHWSESPAMVRSDFVREKSLEAQKFDPYWFYCLRLGCYNLFSKNVCIVIHSNKK